MQMLCWEKKEWLRLIKQVTEHASENVEFGVIWAIAGWNASLFGHYEDSGGSLERSESS